MNKKYQGSIFFNDFLLNLIDNYKKDPTPQIVNFRELVTQITNMDRYTHFIHAYPAKLLQQIPYLFLNNDIFSKEGDTVLDTFCGTGTVPLEASIANRNAIGVDVNPLAALIAKTKTSKQSITSLENKLKDIQQLFKEYQSSKKKFYIPNITNINHWYNKQTIRKLSKIKHIVDNIEETEIKDFFQVVFSICCRKYSYSDPRISVPVRINEEKFPEGHSLREAATKHLNFIKKNEIYEFFIEQSKKNISRLKNYQNSTMLNTNKVSIYNADIKSINESVIPNDTLQMILTSPPYVSAQKYIRASSLSLQWLELHDDNLASLDKQSIGREHFSPSVYKQFHVTGFNNIDDILLKIYKKNKLRAYITYTYLVEMQQTLQKSFKLLKSNGYFVMVIGNNTIAGYEFLTYKYLIEIAESIGFKTKLVLIDDIKSRGLMTKRNKTASVISREYIIVFKK
ncbi:DNA methyltransferase [Halarcobacter sp.]|uniref:DNA methyltransferase n=1 Tax=Halarcobacter sp. TaxID=2321133 RepID=UPI003B00C933